MRLGLGLGISRSGKTGNYFSAAKTIITAIETRKGSAMTSAQRKAIDTFIRTETAAGRWGTVIKRFFLPGWANASANAYDWVSGAVGTFVNNPTSANGYVQGNGTSQYFDFGVSGIGLGQTPGSATLGALIYGWGTLAAFEGIIGSSSGAMRSLIQSTSTNNSLQALHSGSPSNMIASSNGLGIIILTSTSTTSRELRIRKTSGESQLAFSTATDTTPLEDYKIYAMGRNATGSLLYPSSAKHGAWFAGGGMQSSDVIAFSANLKILWETLYGLTLP